MELGGSGRKFTANISVGYRSEVCYVYCTLAALSSYSFGVNYTRSNQHRTHAAIGGKTLKSFSYSILEEILNPSFICCFFSKCAVFRYRIIFNFSYRNEIFYFLLYEARFLEESLGTRLRKYSSSKFLSHVCMDNVTIGFIVFYIRESNASVYVPYTIHPLCIIPPPH